MLLFTISSHNIIQYRFHFMVNGEWSGEIIGCSVHRFCGSLTQSHTNLSNELRMCSFLRFFFSSPKTRMQSNMETGEGVEEILRYGQHSWCAVQVKLNGIFSRVFLFCRIVYYAIAITHTCFIMQCVRAMCTIYTKWCVINFKSADIHWTIYFNISERRVCVCVCIVRGSMKEQLAS